LAKIEEGWCICLGELPLVSVLIPAYNRPHLLRAALQKAIEQTYKNIEIIICDDSTNISVLSMVIPYLNTYPQIKYIKNEEVLFLKNWDRCLALASGDYINFLMDDDLFHPNKIELMMSYYLNENKSAQKISLVTSYRQVINEEGNPLPPLDATVKLFEQTRIVEGIALGNFMLTNGRNNVGEPTSVLFRKSDLIEPYGVYHAKQYTCLNDMATWLSLLSRGYAVYIPEPLSSFRLHSTQNSRNLSIVATAIEEWTRLIVQSRNDGFLGRIPLFRTALYYQRTNMQMLSRAPEFRPYRTKIDAVLKQIEMLLKDCK
jgi:glycosyltransferase involved in cell wall biosynthesis